MINKTILFVFPLLLLSLQDLRADHTLQIIAKMVGPDSTSNMGTRVTGIGDINHDGFDDVGVTVPSRGKTYVFYGGNPMDTVPDLLLKGHWCISSAGDVNGDGYKDVITSDLHYCYVFYDSPTGLDTIPDIIIPPEYSGDYFGSNLIPAGDVNKDGYDDILILAPNYPNNHGFGKVYLFFGGDPMDTIPDWHDTGGSGAAGSGTRRIPSACAADFNGDGWIDIVVGKVGYYYAGIDSFPGKVDIFLGSIGGFDTLPDFVINPDQATNYQQQADFGWWVSNLKDFNNDGYEDLAILLSDICGYPYVYFGGNLPDTLPGLLLGEGLTRSDNFTCAGDVNGDGYVDVVNGNICWGGDWGVVELYLGGQKFDAKKDKWMTEDDLPPDFLENVGHWVAAAGDVNGDGIDDIIFSADNFWPTNRGEVFILAGDTSIYSGVKQDETENQDRPQEFELNQNYPNPFNSTTNINFTIGVDHGNAPVSIKIYNLSGQLVRNLLNEEKKTGTYTLTWDGKSNSGKEVGSGIYFYQLKTNGIEQCRKMLLIK